MGGGRGRPKKKVRKLTRKITGKRKEKKGRSHLERKKKLNLLPRLIGEGEEILQKTQGLKNKDFRKPSDGGERKFKHIPDLKHVTHIESVPEERESAYLR